MDVPTKYSSSEFVQLAKNRDNWRMRVRSLKQGTTVTITMSVGDKPTRRFGRRRRPPHPTLYTPVKNRKHKHAVNTPTSSEKTVKATQRYLKRDAHEVFFRVGTKRNRRRTPVRPKAKRPRPLTDKERVEFAKEHYELHHDNRTAPTPDQTVERTRMTILYGMPQHQNPTHRHQRHSHHHHQLQLHHHHRQRHQHHFSGTWNQ